MDKEVIFTGFMFRRKRWHQVEQVWGDWDYATIRGAGNNPGIYTSKGRALLNNTYRNSPWMTLRYDFKDLPDSSFELIDKKLGSNDGRYLEEVIEVEVCTKVK